MAKELSTDVVTQIDADQNQPVMLVEIQLNAGTLRFAGTNGNYVFPSGGDTWSAKAMWISRVEQSAEGQIGRISVDLDNVTSDISAYLDKEDFYGKTIIIKRVYRGVSGSTDYNEVFRGFCEEITRITKDKVTIPCTVGKPLQRFSLQQVFMKHCNRSYGDVVCNQDGYSDLSTASDSISGVSIESGNTNYIIDTVNLTGTTPTWKNGLLYIREAGGVTEKYGVDSFQSGNSKVFFTPSGSTNYTNATYEIQSTPQRILDNVPEDSGNTNYIIDTKNYLSNATDMWAYGRIEIWKKGSGATYYRDIMLYNSATSKVFWDVGFTFAVTSAYSYNIYRGCSKTFQCCSGTYTYGPSSGNTANFLGFLHIGGNRMGVEG